MIFWIITVGAILAPIIVGIVYRNHRDCGENVGGTIACAVLGWFVIFVLSNAIGSTFADHKPTHETTYKVAESNSPMYDGSTLSFVYTENGASKTFSKSVEMDNFVVEKPREIKITHYDAMNWLVVPWPLEDGHKAEFIK